MHEYARHGVIYRVFCPAADICQVIYLDCANNFLTDILLHSRHLKEQAHFLGVCDLHIEVIWVIWVNKRSGINEGILHVGKY